MKKKQPVRPMDSSLNPAENIIRSLPETPPPDSGRALAPFTTNYDLTLEQEEAAMSLMDQWERTLKSSSGWDQTNSPNFLFDGNGADPLILEGQRQRPHFVKRAFYTAMSENEWGFRRWMYPDSIFEKSNISAPLARRVSRAMAAKAIGFFFGSKPYFYSSPVGPSDEMIADAVQKVAEDRIEASRGTAALRDSMQTAFDLGESVIKVTHRRKQDLYKKKGNVLVDVAGNPVLRQDGEYISEDRFAVNEAGQKTYVDGTVIPNGARFAPGLWARVRLHYSGPDVSEIDPRCILAPLDAPSLDDAECVLHMYEVTATDLAAMFTDSRTGAQVVKAVDLLQGIRGDLRVGAVDPMAPDVNQAVKTTKVKVQEFWVRMDADGDGIAEDVCFVRVDTGNGQWRPLFYDYVANVTATGKRPFSVIRPIRRRGSWTGIGAMELFEKHQEIVDLMLNRWSFATSTSGVLTVIDPTAFIETDGKDSADIELNNGKYLRVKPGRDADKAVKRFYLEDTIGPQWQQIMQFFLQLAMNESGVQHANDGGMAGLHATELATGIKDVRRAGDELFGVFVASLEDGVTSVVDMFVHTLFAKVEESIVARITENPGVTQMWEVTKDQVAGLSFDVKITLARYHTAHLFEAVNSVLPHCFAYADKEWAKQEKLKPLIVQMLKSVQINDPDKIASPILPFDPATVIAAIQTCLSASLPPELQQAIELLVTVVQSASSEIGQAMQPQAAA